MNPDTAKETIAPGLNMAPVSTTTAADSESLLPDATLARLRISVPGYKLLRKIGDGGQAVVFMAVQEATGRRVAVKLLREGPLADENARERHQREVRVLAALDHPNIVGILDSGKTDDERDYLVMDYIAGQSLDEFLKVRQQVPREREDPAVLLRLFLKICDAVNAAHLRGIVHRDLSPSNIRIDERGEPHVLDFGLARTAFDRFMNVGQREISVSGQFLGKLAYASPEQARGKPDQIDVRTDVYALGVILYQMLTGGSFPYEVVGNIADVLKNIINSEPTPPSKLIEARDAAPVADKRRLLKRSRPAVNEAIEAIVLRALHKQREQRYQNAGELAREIGNYLSGLPTTITGRRDDSALRRLAVRAARLTERAKSRTSWKRLVCVGLVSAVTAVGACGVYYLAAYTIYERQIRARIGIVHIHRPPTTMPNP